MCIHLDTIRDCAESMTNANQASVFYSRRNRVSNVNTMSNTNIVKNCTVHSRKTTKIRLVVVTAVDFSPFLTAVVFNIDIV